jgi:RNA polymerase sigma-70 factor (ECF subfamily)
VIVPLTFSSLRAEDLAANSCPSRSEATGTSLRLEFTNLHATEGGQRPLTDAERERIERLVAQHRPLLRRLCRAQLSQREDAENLEAIAVMSVCRRFASYDPARGAFGTWLGTIVRNEASDWRRRAARQPVVVPSDEATEAALERAVARSYEPSTLPDLPELGRLPELLRQAFVLVKLGGLSSAEAARAMGTTDGTVRTYVWKARRQLRQMCQKAGLANLAKPARPSPL